jgi:hypothetical protein
MEGSNTSQEEERAGPKSGGKTAEYARVPMAPGTVILSLETAWGVAGDLKPMTLSSERVEHSGTEEPKASPRLRSVTERSEVGYCKFQVQNGSETAPLEVIQDWFLAKCDPWLRSVTERPEEGTRNQGPGMDEDLRTEILVKTTINDLENMACPGSSLFREVAFMDPKTDHRVSCDIINSRSDNRQASGASLGKTTIEQHQDGPGRRCMQNNQRPCQAAEMRTLSMAKQSEVEFIWKEAGRRLEADRYHFSLAYSGSKYLPEEGAFPKPEQIFEIRWKGRGRAPKKWRFRVTVEDEEGERKFWGEADP